MKLNLLRKLREYLGRTVLSLVSSQKFAAETQLVAALDTYQPFKSKFESSKPSSPVVYWLIPPFENGNFGGPMTIFRIAKQFDGHGLAPVFVKTSLGGLTHDQISELGLNYSSFDVRTCASYDELLTLPPAKAAMATFWTTAYQVASMPNVENRGYLVQDWEPSFYESGSLSLLAKNSYRLGLDHLVNTEQLSKAVGSYSESRVFAFTPSVDKSRFFEGKPWSSREKRVVVYWRPNHKRNCTELIYQSLKIALARDSDISFDLVGESTRSSRLLRDLGPRVRLLGVMSPDETASLYRTARAGIALMDTPHPSYLPFELMASGALPVTTWNPDTAWFLRDRVNALVSVPTATGLAESILEAMDHLPGLTEGMRATIERLPTWEAALDKPVRQILDKWSIVASKHG